MGVLVDGFEDSLYILLALGERFRRAPEDSGKGNRSDAMTRRLSILAVLFAIGLAASPAGAASLLAPSPRHPDMAGGDPASVSAFVGQLRSEAERAQIRPRS